jgi:hypothetical protein
MRRDAWRVVACVMNDPACGGLVLYDHWFSFYPRSARIKRKQKDIKYRYESS